MDIREAIKKLRHFLIRSCNGKVQASSWINIDGKRICNECCRHQRSALYIYVSETSPLFLKCFRANCDLRRLCTPEDLDSLGFKDAEAIKAIMNNTNRTKFEFKGNSDDRDVLLISTTELSEKQRSYFYSRCNFIPTEDDIKTFRILPNFREVVFENLSLDSNFMENYLKIFNEKNTNEYIAYFTNDNKKFYFRSITNTSFVSKGQLSIGSSTSPHIYSVTRGYPVYDIVLCEGFFDMVNIYNKFAILDNATYSCTGGFAQMESHITELYKRNIDTAKRLIIFADSDAKNPYSGRPTLDEKAYKELFKRIYRKIPETAFQEIMIVFNKASKDFGDLRDPIQPERLLVTRDSNGNFVFNKM
ncbi:MAG: hypothetical protein ACRC92_20490 [Peptostreptococcaceae bacterium]